MLDLFKLLTHDNGNMTPEAIDYVIDKAVERVIDKFWQEFSQSTINQVRYFNPAHHFNLSGDTLIFYGANVEIMKERVAKSFARYELIEAWLTSEYHLGIQAEIGYDFKISMTTELWEKISLSRSVAQSNAIPTHLIHKI